ncbi:MAG: hypothetical protein NC127_03450 [Muribaculum sp.]|nr:hypothetical protein [Muribaculum sp.]
MDLRRFIIGIFLLAACMGVSSACTSAIISGRLTHDGRPLLWKHRDTGCLDNFVSAVRAKSTDEYNYVALFNMGDSLLSEAWIGVNEAGFAVMNTASYNLAPDTASYKDREGAIMSHALKRCRTLLDFEALLSGLPRPLGVQANFGAIDAEGHGAYYETCDTGYIKFDLADAPEGYMTRTNYSCSGASDTGFGYIREQNERELIKPYVDSCRVSPELFTEVLSRSFYHSLIGRDFEKSADEWIVDQDFIPRYSSSASVVIEGVLPGMSADEAVMWTALGYPPCSYVQAVTVNEVPDALLPAGSEWRSPFCDEVMARKSDVFPVRRGSGSHYIHLPSLKQWNTECRRRSLENYNEFRSKKRN